MKRLMVSLFFATIGSVAARDVQRELDTLTSEIERLRRSRAEFASRERQLRSRLQQVETPAGTSSKQAIRAELEETQQLIAAFTGRERELRTQVNQLRSSPEYRTLKAISGDKRHPTKADVSGVWTSGPNLTGYTVQLEQEGGSVTGQGYYWGCLGIYDHFRVTGSYKKEVLSLTFNGTERKVEKHVFQYGEERGHLRFESQKAKTIERIIPVHELR